MAGWRGVSQTKLKGLPADSQAFFEFMAWLQFCDTVAKNAHPLFKEVCWFSLLLDGHRRRLKLLLLAL